MKPQTDPWIYDPLPTAKRFHSNLKTRFKGFSGPIGTGKSYALAYEALFLQEINAGLTGLLGAPTFPMLREATQAAFLEVLDIEEIAYIWHKSDNRVTLTDTGSHVLFRSVDDYERLRGTNLAWFGLDELTYCPEQAWLRLEGRLRHPHARRLCGFAAWTPKGFDWVYEKFILNTKKSPNYMAYRASPAENKHLLPDYYENLKGSYDERFFRQEGLGEYLDIGGGTVYYAYSAANKRPLAFDPGFGLVWSLDFNNDPMCSVIGQTVDRTTRADALAHRTRQTYNVLHEICLPDSHTEEACREFVRRTEKYLKPDRRMVVDVYGDASGAQRQHSNVSDYQILKEFFGNDRRYQLLYHIRPSNPAVKDRVTAVNSALCNTRGEHRCFLDPECIELDRDLNQVAWKKDLAGNSTGELAKTDKRRTHVSDALGYWLEFLFNAPKVRIGSA